jgi:hypothetical protein
MSGPVAYRRPVRTSEKLAAIGGVLLHLGFGVFPFAATGLLAPLWAIVVLYLWWLALGVVLVRLLRGTDRRPFVAPLVPLVALAGWFGFLTFGDLVLGWTA